jgi:hypothetical protein
MRVHMYVCSVFTTKGNGIDVNPMHKLLSLSAAAVEYYTKPALSMHTVYNTQCLCKTSGITAHIALLL